MRPPPAAETAKPDSVKVEAVGTGDYAVSASEAGGGTWSYTPPTYTYSYTPVASISAGMRGKTESRKEHVTGAHGMEVDFVGECTEESATVQGCKVNNSSRFIYETGTTDNLIYTHVNMTDETATSATGPRGQNITCSAAVGIATSNCLNPSCSFSVSLSGQGVNVSMSGGDLWNGQLAHSHTCNLTTPGKCNGVAYYP